MKKHIKAVMAAKGYTFIGSMTDTFLDGIATSRKGDARGRKFMVFKEDGKFHYLLVGPRCKEGCKVIGVIDLHPRKPERKSIGRYWNAYSSVQELEASL